MADMKRNKDGTKIAMGWDITVWVGDSYELAEQIFSAIEEMVSEKFDIHEFEESCVIEWNMSMSPALFDLDLFNEEELREIDGKN